MKRKGSSKWVQEVIGEYEGECFVFKWRSPIVVLQKMTKGKLPHKMKEKLRRERKTKPSQSVAKGNGNHRRLNIWILITAYWVSG